MNNAHTNDDLSAYYDDQLPPDRHVEAVKHATECPECAAELEAYAKLSQMVAASDLPSPPESLWSNIEQQLAVEQRKRRFRLPVGQHHQLSRWLLIAASLLLVAGLGATAVIVWHKARVPRNIVDLSDYLNLFEKDPDQAIKLLAMKYHGRPIVLTRTKTNDREIAALIKELPDNYSIKDAVVLKMPGCTCVHCTCGSTHEDTVAILAQDKSRPVQFGKRPVIHTRCGGTNCQVVQVGSRLAVTWQQGNHKITVIGIRNLDEIEKLIAEIKRKS